MHELFSRILILAQAAQPAAPAAPGDPTGPFRLLGPLVVIMVLFYFMFIRPQKRKEQEARNMVNNIKENDRVITIGGIHGVVTNVQRDAERVTVRVDESNGTKIRVNLSAIAQVVTGDEPADANASKS